MSAGGANQNDPELRVPVARTVHFRSPASPQRRLICFPFAGGGAATYRLWNRLLPDDIDVVFVQFPGRDPSSKLNPLTSIESMVSSALPVVDEHSDLPYSLFGHSMGAAVAYEVASALEIRGAHTPCSLFVSGRRSPDELSDETPITGLPQAAFIDAIGSRYGGIPEPVLQEPELLAMVLPVLRADVQAYENYERLSDRPLRCPVSVFGGRRDDRATYDQLTGWSRIAAAPVGVDLFDGDHFYINDQGAAVTARIAELWPKTAGDINPLGPREAGHDE